MVQRKSLITNGSIWILELDSSPNIGLGFQAPIGSEASVNNGSIGTIWVKYGPLATDWRDFSDEIFSSVTSPILTGGSNDNQSLTLKATNGLGLNGSDLIFKVGNNGIIEALRILNDGRVGINTSIPKSTLEINGSLAAKSITVIADYLAQDILTIFVDAISGLINVSLPPLADCIHRIYNIVKIDSTANLVNIDANLNELINGSLIYTLNSKSSITLQNRDGLEWNIL